MTGWPSPVCHIQNEPIRFLHYVWSRLVWGMHVVICDSLLIWTNLWSKKGRASAVICSTWNEKMVTSFIAPSTLLLIIIMNINLSDWKQFRLELLQHSSCVKMASKSFEHQNVSMQSTSLLSFCLHHCVPSTAALLTSSSPEWGFSGLSGTGTEESSGSRSGSHKTHRWPAGKRR